MTQPLPNGYTIKFPDLGTLFLVCREGEGSPEYQKRVIETTPRDLAVERTLERGDPLTGTRMDLFFDLLAEHFGATRKHRLALHAHDTYKKAAKWLETHKDIYGQDGFSLSVYEVGRLGTELIVSRLESESADNIVRREIQGATDLESLYKRFQEGITLYPFSQSA